MEMDPARLRPWSAIGNSDSARGCHLGGRYHGTCHMTRLGSERSTLALSWGTSARVTGGRSRSYVVFRWTEPTAIQAMYCEPVYKAETRNVIKGLRVNLGLGKRVLEGLQTGASKDRYRYACRPHICEDMWPSRDLPAVRNTFGTSIVSEAIPRCPTATFVAMYCIHV